MDITAIENIPVSAYTVPTDQPESDGTYEWDSTTIVIVEAEAGGKRSLGYSYADEATATLIRSKLKEVVVGADAQSLNGAFVAMVKSIRNLGRPGIASMAISAVDTSLWDLHARLLDVPLATLFGQVRDAMPIYGSGGFTSYSNQQLKDQLDGWASEGIPRVKMNVGRDAGADPNASLQHARQSAMKRNCSSTPTVRTAANRRSRWGACSPVLACAGLRNR